MKGVRFSKKKSISGSVVSPIYISHVGRSPVNATAARALAREGFSDEEFVRLSNSSCPKLKRRHITGKGLKKEQQRAQRLVWEKKQEICRVARRKCGLSLAQLRWLELHDVSVRRRIEE